ncbi:DUF2878 domain-containing protein [uncultured Microbulbifer sp.]|uniref:DUF2878 domain-containing protein n=1 Tax=uncultured Microbulbifer sp. TaxID=348147 RepID=UPI0025CF1163|nr:DUF2878 domain-containing protein [uncultured Microbulbifer sp.]
MWRVVASAVQFQIAWLFCVVVANPIAVALFTLCNLCVHLRYVANLPYEPVWILSVGCAGMLLDTAMFASGVLSSSGGQAFPPIWLLLLWLNFAMALRYCFAFLQKSLWLSAAAGFFAGPASYFTGAYLNGGVVLMSPLFLGLLVLAATWAIFLPLLVALARVIHFRRSHENA